MPAPFPALIPNALRPSGIRALLRKACDAIDEILYGPGLARTHWHQARIAEIRAGSSSLYRPACGSAVESLPQAGPDSPAPRRHR